MADLLTRYVIGFHSREKMENEGYLENWKRKVTQEDFKGNEVYILSIPKRFKGHLWGELEQWLQTRIDNEIID